KTPWFRRCNHYANTPVPLPDYNLRRTISDHEVHGTEIHLVPQPSLDPADPLNWAAWRKAAILICMSLYAFINNYTSSSLSSAFPILATPAVFNPPVPFAKLSHLIAVNVLMQGAANLLWVPLANIFGRRPIVLLNILILTLSSMWAGLATSFNSLLVARFFMGVGGAPADTIAPDIVGEIYFMHQRGRAMAIYTVFLAIGSLLGGLTGSYIAVQAGVPWIHWINVILSAALFVLCLFFQPETLFERERMELRPVDDPDVTSSEGKPSAVKTEKVRSDSAPNYAPYTFLRSLNIGTYRGGVAAKFLGPFLTLRLPGVWLVMLWYGGLVGGVVTISTIGATLVAAPPYLWGSNAGLINVGGVVGAILGALCTYALADFAITRRAKHESHGYAEPEDRLAIAFPGLFFATTGLWMFGFCAQNPSPKAWVGLEVGLGMLTFGLMQVPSIGFTYVIEAYNAVSGDCFVAITCLRAIISFAWTFFVGTWTEKDGPAVAFGVFGGLMGAFSLLTIPQILWGKRTRIATAKWLPEHPDH
ncbi:MFS general substrate transporter, partial [Glonium stellatum]